MSTITAESSSISIASTGSKNEFQGLTADAVKRQESYGKVSGSTGWSSVFSVLGHAVPSEISGDGLHTSISQNYGSTVASRINQQLGLSQAASANISIYKVAKAVAMVEELSFLHNVKMMVGDEVRSLDPNDSFYLVKKDQFRITAEANKNELLRKQEWLVITTTMALDPQNSIEKTTTTTITPAGKTKALQKAYANAEIGGIPSSDTTSEHAVGLRINKSDQFSIVSSGLDVPLKVPEEDVAEGIIQNRFEERLLVNLETQGKLPTAAPAGREQGSSAENPITISMTDFGLLTADVSKEGKAQDKQLAFLKEYNGEKTISVTYKNADATNITIHVRPTVRAFNFGAQWIDRSIIGRAVTWLKSCFGYKGHERAAQWRTQNEAAFNSLIGAAPSTDVNETTSRMSSNESGDTNDTNDTSKALAAIKKFTGESTEKRTDEDKDLIKTIYKNYTDSELNPDNITEEQKNTLQQVKANIKSLLPKVQQARERLKYPAHYDYHDEALVLCLSSMIGAAPNIHCKSGKDRTALLLSYSQWIMHEIKNPPNTVHAETDSSGIPQPGTYTPEQRARLDKFLVGTGNGYWQFLNTMNVGNKQAAGWWSFRSNFYTTLTPMLQRIVAGNEADSSN